jgi:hypothetical protein
VAEEEEEEELKESEKPGFSVQAMYNLHKNGGYEDRAWLPEVSEEGKKRKPSTKKGEPIDTSGHTIAYGESTMGTIV